MSLMRLALWLGLLVLLLPTDAQQQARFTDFANGALGRASTFCDRNGKSCNVAAEAWGTFLKKAEFGIRLVSDLVGVGGRQPSHGQNPDLSLDQGPDQELERAPPPARRVGKADPRGTLSPADQYRPPWRGSARPDRN
jgi:hypothetical protein